MSKFISKENHLFRVGFDEAISTWTMDYLVVDWCMIWSAFIWTIFWKMKLNNEFVFMKSDQVINQPATRLSMVQVQIIASWNQREINDFLSTRTIFEYGGYHIIKQKVFEGALSWVCYKWKFNYKTLDSLRKYVRNFNYKTFCSRYTEKICSHSVRRQILDRTVL